MPDLEKLGERYRKAQEAYADDRSESNYKKYKKAKQEFADARVEQRLAEEADPDHPRGTGLVVVGGDN